VNSFKSYVILCNPEFLGVLKERKNQGRD